MPELFDSIKKKDLIKNKRTLQLIGLLTIVVSVYGLLKAGGYSFIFCNGTIGLHKEVFGHPDNSLTIISEFILWTLLFLGGLSIIKGNKTGLKIGLITTIIGGLVVLTQGIMITTHKLKYSDKTLVNGVDIKMTSKEKWEIIYSEPTLYLILTILTTIIITLIIRRIKLITE